MSAKKTPHCSRCGRVLTDPYSITVGMGPECRGGAARTGKLPKPQWSVSGGRVTLVGLTPAQAPPAAQTEVVMTQTTWMRVGEQPAHWIKIFGMWGLMAACTKTLSRNGAERVETESFALASAPGRYYQRPGAQIETCEICLRKVQQQA